MIFSRRSIQKFISVLSDVLPSEEIGRIVTNLNRNDRASLGFEWETAILYSLSKIGMISYECNHGGTKYADVTFCHSDSSTVSFVAEIATVSDRGLEDENPVSMLLNLLHEKASILGMTGGFQYRIEGDYIGEKYADRKYKLAMPNRKRLRAYVDRKIVPQLRNIKDSDVELADIKVDEPYKMAIVYRKEACVSGGSHPSFSTAYSLTRNPMYTSLKGKARQLSKTGFNGSKGIFLCDGSCNLFRTERSSGTSSYSKWEVVQDFLRQNSAISFVAMIWVEPPHGRVFERAREHQLHFELIQNKIAHHPLDDEVAKVLHEVPAHLPRPVNAAINGVRRIEAGGYGTGDSHYGGSTVSFGTKSTSVRLSSRAVLDLLSGSTDPARFSEDHWPKKYATTNGSNNPFAVAFAKGMTIQAVSVEHRADEDDDWITFELSWPDVAVTPFRNT